MPLVFGLLLERLPRWTGLASLSLGLLMSISTRLIFGFSYGDQMLTMLLFCASIIFSADLLRHLYKKNRVLLFVTCLFFSILVYTVLTVVSPYTINSILMSTAIIVSLIIGLSMSYFAKIFSEETSEDKAVVAAFFKKLHTPVDLLTEVYSKGVKEISTFPIIGKLTMLIGAMVGVLTFFDMTVNEIIITLILSVIMIISGYCMVYFGGRSEKRYNENMQRELEKAGIKINSEELK